MIRTMPRTSTTHPLHIAELSPGPGMGRIGITLCPGKHQPDALTGDWQRDLATDVAAIADGGGALVVNPHRAARDRRPRRIRARTRVGLLAHRLAAPADPRRVSPRCPVRAGLGAAPRRAYPHSPAQRQPCPAPLQRRPGPRRDDRCPPDGRARPGPDQAIAAVRAARPGAIETSAQLEHVHAASTCPEPTPLTTHPAIHDRALGTFLGLRWRCTRHHPRVSRARQLSSAHRHHRRRPAQPSARSVDRRYRNGAGTCRQPDRRCRP